MSTQPYISFVVPVMNEEDNVTQLHEEIVLAGKKLKKNFEIIFVDDGSTDNTVRNLQKLKPITIIQLRRNFGQTAALDAGIKAAQGEFIATLDGDLQNNPADIPQMLQKLLDEELDVVCGWRQKRKDSFSKRFISSGAKWLRSHLINDGVKDSGCTLRVYRAECFEGVNLRGEMHRFIPAILKWRGFKIGEMPVDHRARIHGTTKYNMKRTLKGFLDMLSLWFFQKYSARPLHFLGAIGLGLFGIGIALGTWLVVARLFFDYSLSTKIWPLAAVFLVLFGFQMFVSGLIMDLIISLHETKHYRVKK